jgi:putative endonuclease
MKEKSEESVWYIYIIETRFGHWYTGVTNDVTARFAAHQQGKGAKNLKGKGPLSLIYSYPVGSKSDACKLEWQIKKLTKLQKRQFVASSGVSSNSTIKLLMNLTTS